MSSVISVENLGKKYLLNHQAAPGSYRVLRDVISDGVRNLGRRMLGHGPGQAGREEFWALRDVSFEVQQGDRVGIIGRNGAGKSTLLKVLSRITEPTTGCARIRGRVASLLEVGTGFHHELTGRENIFLNGTILGMSRGEIRRKFDEIVAFAEVEQFLDTPVKHYSSGMFVRLAFAVAAHLEPDILVVDEVLAVGDAQFQRKCLGKMEEVGKQGRTVLFVSHNMTAMGRLCQKAVWLEQGAVVQQGPMAGISASYLQKGMQFATRMTWEDPARAPGNDKARLRSIRLLDARGESVDFFDLEEPVVIEVEYAVHKPGTVLNLSLSVINAEDIHVFASPSTTDREWYLKEHPAGTYRSRCTIPGKLLNQGRYSVTLLLVENGRSVIAQADRIVSIDTVDSGAQRGSFFGTWSGVVRPDLQWRTELTP